MDASVDREMVGAWVRGYEQAWRTPGTDPLRDLFAADAAYRMSPYEDPARGAGAISELWERERESPEEDFSLAHEVVAVEGDVAVVRVDVAYGDGLEYRDLWVLRFAEDGRCRDFEEWPFWPGQEISARGKERG
jgi:ketosteroid isomerase-like protein